MIPQKIEGEWILHSRMKSIFQSQYKYYAASHQSTCGCMSMDSNDMFVFSVRQSEKCKLTVGNCQIESDHIPVTQKISNVRTRKTFILVPYLCTVVFHLNRSYQITRILCDICV